ncbi:hypothetical protein D910_06609 [Dendroctonus ponderosae]|uniref:Glutathione synthetase n=1 Tax=Dendroctonus ponderosae TaxID=77166 RepID=U4UH56_DENPD|nr:hypothetical protein D910_06609 [Dendroctonus ponderosae]
MSVKRLPSCIPIPLDEKELKELVSKTKDWVVMHGIGIRSKTAFSEDSINFAPYLLLPSTFPRKEFERAVEIQTTLNELMHRVAHNQEFLKETLKDTIQVDEFTGSLYKIWETVLNEGVTQLPENNALTGMTMGLLEAWKIYGDSKAAILVIVEDVTYNICDQRFHEFELKRLNPRVKLMRKTLTDVHMEGSLSENNELMIGNTVVSVVYYRSAYTPEQIPTKKEWGSRLLIERSQAIKCPSIQYHLAGTKKVQQALAKPGALEPFLSDPNKIAAVRDIFTGLFGLDFDEAGDQAIQMALDDPERFVLKPQREGGGNNIYGSEIRDAIMQMKDTKERTAWILMERINPPISTGYMIRPGGQNPPQLAEMISELGIFGVVIGDSQKIMVNRQVGHMLRTKVSTADEGGVAAGYGALDSPYLIDID